MTDNNQIEIMESVFDKNEQVAKELNKQLDEKGVFAVNVLGSPGAGKTSSLIQIIKNLTSDITPYVIEGDIEADFDTQTLKSMGVQAIQINTYGACHLDSPLIAEAVQDLAVGKGLLFIENIGNLVCPAEFEIGEHIKMLISTVTEGSDKPYKYPLAYEKADIIILNKCDLIPYVNFDEEFFLKGVRGVNKSVPVFNVNAVTGEGFKDVVLWITEKMKK